MNQWKLCLLVNAFEVYEWKLKWAPKGITLILKIFKKFSGVQIKVALRIAAPTETQLMRNIEIFATLTMPISVWQAV